MNKKILITGINGFIGQHCAQYFAKAGNTLFGIGHGELKQKTLHQGVSADVSLAALSNMKQCFDVIIHCAGSGSVGYSINNPQEDYAKNVGATREVLEYMRLYNQSAKLIFLSSPAVVGEQPHNPISEDCAGEPVSPYGQNKKLAEEMCLKYHKSHNLSINILRMFSVYGIGLTKQLLWDASQKFLSGQNPVKFFGTGEETRDFVHINDVLKMMSDLIGQKSKFEILNCGCGTSYQVLDVVNMIKNLLGSKSVVEFNQQVNRGNPQHYWADISKAQKLGWSPQILLTDGLKEYIQWVKTIK